MSSSHRQSTFATTCWNVVIDAGRNSSPERHRALTTLFETYWYPLYAFVRRKGYQAAEAQDLTQSFFTELLEKEKLQLADQQRGKFRSFLLVSMNHFLTNEWRNSQTQKRGGGVSTFSLDFDSGEDRYQREPVDPVTPEKIFERRWAMTLLDQAMSNLRDEYQKSSKAQLFDALKIHLGGGAESTPYRELAERLGSTEGAVKVAAHRMRKRCRELLRAEIAETVASDDEIDDELRCLFNAVSGAADQE